MERLIHTVCNAADITIMLVLGLVMLPVWIIDFILVKLNVVEGGM